jgi:hypothetical protein
MTRARAASLALSALCATASLAYGTSFDLDPFDSAELSLVAVTAGLGHPPAQPLHTMLGWLLTRLPVAPLAALACLSIIPAALAIALCAWTGSETTDNESPSSATTSPTVAERAALAAAASLFAAALAPVRASSTRVEVYALAAFLSIAAMVLVRWSAPRRVTLAALLWGLSGATNPVLAAQGAWALLAHRIRAREIRGILVTCALALSATLACYGYAFNAKGRETTTLVWSAPSNVRELLAVITARDFSTNLSLGVATFVENTLRFAGSLLLSGAGLWLVVGAHGLRRSKRDPWFGALIAASVVGVAMVASNVPLRLNNPDYGGYVLVPCAIATAGVTRWLTSLGVGARRSLASSLVVAAVALTVSSGRPSNATRALAEHAIASAPRDAILVLESDHLLFSSLYLQRVEGRRRDVTILNPGWSSSTWAWRWTLAHDPSIQVDLRPGLGRERRLALALANRVRGRAVLAESTARLALANGGELCPRGLLWSTREGCDESTRSTIETARWLRELAREARARRSPWDQRLVSYTAATFGDAARSLGCVGVAARAYASALEEELSIHPARGCHATRRPIEPVDLLEVDSSVLRARLIDATRALEAQRAEPAHEPRSDAP